MDRLTDSDSEKVGYTGNGGHKFLTCKSPHDYTLKACHVLSQLLFQLKAHYFHQCICMRKLFYSSASVTVKRALFSSPYFLTTTLALILTLNEPQDA